MTCLHIHFLEDFGIATWRNALNQYTLVTGPEQGAFYQSLHSVTLLNIKNRVGCMDINVWLGGFQGSLGSEQESSSRPHSRKISHFFFPGVTLCCHGAVSSVCTLPQVAHGLLLTTGMCLWCSWRTFCSDG